MAEGDLYCPVCGHTDLAPRQILIGQMASGERHRFYQEIQTLKCQNCGWLGEKMLESNFKAT